MQGWAPPAEFDEYRLLRPIDRGAMGQVFLAHDTVLRRTVAVKFIAAADPGAAQRERFLVEARAIARLLHPNVVTIFRVGEVEGRPYLVSEYVRGEPLHRLPQPLPPERLLPIALGLGRGLAAAHRRGVLHRDVKPQNAILAEDGEVKLLDFGVAKLLDAEPAPVRAAAAEAPPARSADGAADDGALDATAPHRDRVAPAPPPGAGPAAPPQEAALDATAPHRDRLAPPPEEPAPDDDLADESPRTAAGALVGTPLYMAPEIWAGEAATPRSDVYSFGALLYQLASGRPPHSERALPELAAAATGRDAAPLGELAPAQDGRLCAVVDRCLRRDPAERFASGVELLAALEALAPVAAPQGMLPAGNPYRGLHCFEAEQRALFFGREREIAALLELLRGQPLLLLTGDSGVGKSSLCRAGLLPRIEEGALGEGRRWTALRLVPGPRPLLSLAAALRPLLEPGGDEEALGRRLAERPEALPALLAERLGDRAGLVLFWDQLEELLTLAPRDEAAPCARLLGQLAARVPPVRGLRVLGTVRGDFLGRLAALPGLLGALEQGIHVLGPPSPEALREAIVGPARLTGVRFGSEALIDTLVEATVAAEGGLPLLQFALSELWELRDRSQQLIPESAFAAIGGVSGALARHADSVLLALPAAERQAARRLLTRLVTAQGTRLRCGAADLLTGAAGERGALEALVRGRLLRALDAEGGAAYELAHEALIAGWGTLRELLSRDGERRAARQRVEAAAAEWERLGRAPAALWSAVQLRELDGAGLDPSELGARGRDFAQASRRALRRARRRRLGLLLGAPLVALLGYGALRLQEHRRLDRAIAERLTAAQAVLAQARAAAQAAQAARQGAFALFDEGPGKEEPAEARWAEALGQAAAARAAYQQAGRALETALLLDTSRAEPRRALATCLYEHALLEEAAHRLEQRDALLQRLATYDDDGELRRRELAPATLELAVTPAGARARLARYAAQAGTGRRALQAPQDLGAAASGLRGPLSLPPGSYLLTLSAPGRAEVRYPVLLARGERLRAALRLPKANEVPPGFAYVPPGRFLYGSADAENWRRAMLTTQPLHALWLPGFLIGRHEVTFADWLTFLDALPPAERERRRPRVSAHNGGLDLTLGDGGAALSLGATSFRYSARAGEPLRYRDRDRRAAQDWRRFPVSGVSWDDAQAYLAWLDRSGRVPGARLCHEREWERAARGADDRVYPHGDELAPDDANHDVTYGRRPLAFGPDEVGAHPASDSPFGVADLAGNAWEWVRPIGGPSEVLYRGGGWYNGAPAAVATNRQPGEPAMRNIENGLRVCAPPPPEGPER